MIERAKRWFNPYPDTPGALRLGFVAAYIGVVGTLVVYSSLVSRCSGQQAPARLLAMIGLLAIMLFVERFDLARNQRPTPQRLGIALLIVRIALIQGVVILDCTGLAELLYVVVPFAAYFVLGAGISRIIGFACWLLVALHSGQTSSAQLQFRSDALTIVIIFSLLLLFLDLIAGHIDRDQRSKEQMRQLLAQLETSHRQLQAYSDRVAELAVAAERNRLARDIHDSLGHYLTAISIQLEKAQAYRSRNSEEADRAVRDAQQMARTALQDVRQSVGALRNADDRFSLRQSLADLVARLDGGAIEIDCHVEGDERDYAGPVLAALYRVAQEGLTNVQKHAQARHVLLDVQLGEIAASLRLRDDGAGFDTTALKGPAASVTRGYGLQGLQERLELVSGQMSITSGLRTGTEIIVVIPKELGQLAVP